MHRVVLHIGSNIGNRLSYLSQCKSLIVKRIGKIENTSSIYETEAWGKQDQDSFLNQAFEVSTDLEVLDLLLKCQEIEGSLNRQRDVKWGPRTIDIDIIFFDDLHIDDENIQIPHPRMHERNFVLYPLSEIVPDWEHPILSKSVKQLMEESKDRSNVSI